MIDEIIELALLCFSGKDREDVVKLEVCAIADLIKVRNMEFIFWGGGPTWRLDAGRMLCTTALSSCSFVSLFVCMYFCVCLYVYFCVCLYAFLYLSMCISVCLFCLIGVIHKGSLQIIPVFLPLPLVRFCPLVPYPPPQLQASASSIGRCFMVWQCNCWCCISWQYTKYS